jgi:hypothetical protein
VGRLPNSRSAHNPNWHADSHHLAESVSLQQQYPPIPMTNAQDNTRPTLASLPGISRRALFLIFGAALLGRLVALWSFLTSHPHNYFFSHPWEMGLVANSLLHGLGYSSPFGGSTGPTAFIAPGYPTFVAAIFLLFGTDTFASVLAITLIHIALSLLTIWLIMHIAATVFDSRSAVVAGAFWAISLPLLWIPCIFWETSFSQCALIGMVAFALHCRRAPSTIRWVILGASCAIAALINPALIFSLLAVMGWLAYQTRHVSKTAPILGLLTLLVVFAPWPIRNAYRFHAFIPLRSTVGFELWMGNRPGVDGRLDESVFLMYNRQELAKYLSMGEVAYTRDKSEKAWSYIRANPTTFLDLSARRFVRFWSGTGNIDKTHIYETHALLTTLFGFTGLILGYRRGFKSFAILMALPLLLFPMPYYITHAEFRYRLNIDPLLTVLAAYAVTQIYAVITRKSAAVSPASEQVAQD